MSLEAKRSRTEKGNESEAHSYSLESGVTVEVAARVFRSEHPQHAPDRAVVYLPSWALGAHSKSVEKLSQAFSNEYGADTHTLSTRSQERGGAREHPDLLMEEARAVKAYMQEKGLKQVILTGSSQGADKAIDVATLIQDDPDFTVDGLVLVNPVGLYEQGAPELAQNFITNAALDTPKSIVRSLRVSSLAKDAATIGKGIRLGNEIIGGVVREARRSKQAYWRRFKSEVQEMARQNPHVAEVAVPVVIVTGVNDSVSDAERIIPTSAIDPLKKELGGVTREEASEEVSARDTTLVAREKYLQEKLFPKSPYIRMLVPEKLGLHSLAILRAESVARTSLYMIERFKRRERTEEV